MTQTSEPRDRADPAADLTEALSRALDGARVVGLERMSGGASRETWRFDVVADDGRVDELVLRRDPPGRPGPRGGMAREAAAIRAASDAGLAVPEVLVATDDPAVWGAAGVVMRRVPGEALARRILRDEEYAPAREALTAQCATFLAGLHALDPAAVGRLPDDDPLEGLAALLPTLGEPSPTFELAVRWLRAHRPAPTGDAVVHGDFRLGNVLVGPEGLRAVLDWELVHRGDPLEDLGWLCVRAWRFGSPLPVAGVGTREELLAAYAAAGGPEVDPEVLRWWEVLNTLKWGVICMTQAAAHLSGALRSVELAAIGRRVSEQEWDLLELLVGPERAAAEPVPEPRTPADTGFGRPTATELLEAVEQFLRDDVMGATSGRVAFHARVAANVVATVARELAAPTIGGDQAALAAAIRAADHDDDLPAVAEQLLSVAAARVAVSNPRHR